MLEIKIDLNTLEDINTLDELKQWINYYNINNAEINNILFSLEMYYTNKLLYVSIKRIRKILSKKDVDIPREYERMQIFAQAAASLVRLHLSKMDGLSVHDTVISEVLDRAKAMFSDEEMHVLHNFMKDVTPIIRNINFTKEDSNNEETSNNW